MHRIPLKLDSPVATWDYTMRESDLFARTMNPANMKETKEFLDILQEQTELHDKDRKSNAHKYFVCASRYMANEKGSTTKSGLYCVNKIILAGANDSRSLLWALKVRGDYHFRMCSFCVREL